MRKIIQISTAGETGRALYALCDDGTVWWYYIDVGWRLITGIPQDPPVQHDFKDTPLSEFTYWSGRVHGAFLVDGIRTIGDLLSKSPAEILRTPNMGPASLKEIQDQLARYGLKLEGDDAQSER